MKHAFLIIAHNEFDLLQRLIDALSCPSVDFFVHIDSKVKDMPGLTVSNGSELFFTKDRVDTRWGDVSQIRTELALVEGAIHHGKYSFYHIISGTHFPIKPVEDILSYYDSFIGNTVLDHLCQSTVTQERLKLRRVNLFTRRLEYGSHSSRRNFQRAWRMGHEVQKLMGINLHREVSFYWAANWVSLSEEAAEMLVSRRKEILRLFRWSFCGDEYFVPTMLLGSELRDKVVDSERILMQEMGDANPRVLTMADYETLASSDCLFARKFSVEHMDVVDRLIKEIHQR